VTDTYAVLPGLVRAIKEACPTAQILWHMTWAYQGDSNHSEFPKYNSDQNTMYQAILSAVQNKILTNADIVKVIPVGTAVQNARTSYLGDNLTRDGYHMDNGIARYGASCTVFETLITPKYNKRLDGNTYTYDVSNSTTTPVTSANASVAREAARYAVKNPYVVTQMKN
jgi:hypothetical protein